MAVSISPELNKEPYWPEIRDYVNDLTAEEDRDNTIYIRSATQAEAARLRDSGKSLYVTGYESGALELVIGFDKSLNYEEIIDLDRKYGAASGKSIFIQLWAAQIACIGRSIAGCDS